MFGNIFRTQPVVLSLSGIADPTSVDFEIPNWDRESRIKAQGLLSTLLSSAFMMAFFIAKNVLDLVKPLAVKLQKRDLDILFAIIAYRHVYFKCKRS